MAVEFLWMIALKGSVHPGWVNEGEDNVITTYVTKEGSHLIFLFVSECRENKTDFTNNG